MGRLNKNKIKALGGVDKALTEALSTIFPAEKIKFYEEDMSVYAKLENYRSSFYRYPIYENDDHRSQYVSSIILDSTTFEKDSLKLETEIFGFKIVGKYSFMGEVSKFYIPAGLIYSIINNRIETSIPKEILNVIVEIETPAVAVFNMGGGYLSSDRKYYIKSITYLFKESGKYLTVKPFESLGYNDPFSKNVVLRFFEFFLNLVQFFNENEKIVPHAYDVIEPSLLTMPMLGKFGNASTDLVHSNGARVVGPINVVNNEYVINKVNETYTKARNSFQFLGQHPVEALGNFLAIVRIMY
jgi:hypothetical protein